MNTLISRILLAGCILAPLAQAAEENASAPAAVSASAPAAATASAPAAAKAPVVPSKAEVTKAIAVLENTFLGEEAPLAAQTVMQFVQHSKDVNMQLSPKTTPWVFGDKPAASKAEEQFRYMLLVAYMAGNTKSQLAAGKPVDNPQAGWQFALKSYETIKKKNKVKIAELETLKTQHAKNQLPALAKKALQYKP